MRSNLSRKATFLVQKGWPYKRSCTVQTSGQPVVFEMDIMYHTRKPQLPILLSWVDPTGKSLLPQSFHIQIGFSHGRS